MLTEERMNQIMKEEAEKAARGTRYDDEDLLANARRHDSVLEMTEEGARQFFGYYFKEMAEMLEEEADEDH